MLPAKTWKHFHPSDVSLVEEATRALLSGGASVPVFPSSPFLVSSIVFSFLMLVPVPVTLPGTPVLFHGAVGHAFVFRRDLAEMRRYAEHRARYSLDGDASPRSVIICRQEPLTTVGTVPVSVIKENILPHIGRIIHISPRYHEHDRRGRYDQPGQGDRDVDVDSGDALGRERESVNQE